MEVRDHELDGSVVNNAVYQNTWNTPACFPGEPGMTITGREIPPSRSRIDLEYLLPPKWRLVSVQLWLTRLKQMKFQFFQQIKNPFDAVNDPGT